MDVTNYVAMRPSDRSFQENMPMFLSLNTIKPRLTAIMELIALSQGAIRLKKAL